jgi:hypothetical protein
MNRLYYIRKAAGLYGRSVSYSMGLPGAVTLNAIIPAKTNSHWFVYRNATMGTESYTIPTMLKILESLPETPYTSHAYNMLIKLQELL